MRELGSGSRGRNYCQYRDFSVPNFDTPSGPPRREGGVSNIMVLLLALKENVQKSPREKRVVCTCDYPRSAALHTRASSHLSYHCEQFNQLFMSSNVIARECHRALEQLDMSHQVRHDKWPPRDEIYMRVGPPMAHSQVMHRIRIPLASL